MFDCTIPNNTLSRAELNYESGSVRNIHYGDILIKYGSVVDVQNDEIPFATGKSSDDFKGALLQDGDIIIADTAEDETTGKACEIGNSQGLDVVSGLHTMVCRPRNKMALGYLGYYLNSDAYHHQLLPLMQGIKVLSLSRTNVQKTMVCYPKSKAEQQLIADCFRNLDNLITLHQRNSADFVSRFFSDFTNTWEQRKFSNLTEIRSASRVHKEEWQTRGVPFYRSSDVMAALNGTENEKAFISEELYEKLSAVSGKLEKGDVLVTGGGSVGKPYIVPNNKPLYTKDADLLWIKNNENLDPYFVYTFFFSPTFTDYLNSVSHVGTIAHYTITQLGETPISLPCVSEQQQIGSYFRNLDNLITLHQCEYIFEK